MIVMGFAYLFVSMMVLIVSEDVLESGLDQAYADFNNSAAVFLADNAGLDSQVRNNNIMSINRFASDFLNVLGSGLKADAKVLFSPVVWIDRGTFHLPWPPDGPDALGRSQVH